MNVEIECKLIARDAGALAGAPKALRETCSAVRYLGTEVIRDVYLDTPDWRFFHAGYACRIRRASRLPRSALKGGSEPFDAAHSPELVEGHGRTERAVLTLKALSRPRRMVSTREELEQPISLRQGAREKDFAAALLHESALGKKVGKILAGRKARVIFRIQNRRKTYAVRYGRNAFRAHASMDDFTVLAAGKRRRLAEVEIEIKSGTPADLRRLARLLAARIGLETGSRAKFQQGLELAGLLPTVLTTKLARPPSGGSPRTARTEN